MNLDLSKIRLRGRRLLISKPKPVGSDTEYKVGSLYMVAESRRMRQTYGFIATVEKVGPACADEFKTGDKVIVNEFAGTPIYHEHVEQPYWLVGEDEVSCVVTE